MGRDLVRTLHPVQQLRFRPVARQSASVGRLLRRFRLRRSGLILSLRAPRFSPPDADVGPGFDRLDPIYGLRFGRLDFCRRRLPPDAAR